MPITGPKLLGGSSEVERSVEAAGVGGPIPSLPAKVVRVWRNGSRPGLRNQCPDKAWGFKSLHPHQVMPGWRNVANALDLKPSDLGLVGSSPTPGTKYAEVVEWQTGQTQNLVSFGA